MMLKNKLTLFFSIATFSISFLFGENIQNILIEISIGLFIGFLIVFLVYLFQNKARLKMRWDTEWVNQKRKIRFSMSYLYRIKIDHKYLLVKNTKWEQFQLVGGKYKKLDTATPTLEKLGVFDDIKIPQKGMKEDDLALFCPAPNTSKFLDWFKTHKDREVSHWREFYDELISTKILSHENFPHIKYRFVGSVTTPLQTSENFGCLEILHYDILDLVPNHQQKIELRNLLKKGDTEKIKWATLEEIDKKWGGENNGSSYRISKHTKWAVRQEWTKEHEPTLG